MKRPVLDAERAQAADEAQARIDQACLRFMTDPDLEPLRLWWEGETMRSMLPPGPVDPLRLAMGQGDKERYLQLMARAARRRAVMTQGKG